VTLPEASSRSFWLYGSAWEYPSFENAETFVSRLVKNGLIAADPYVRDVLRGQRQRMSQRTEQRHFVRATGMTHATIRQIERARHAANLLQRGGPIAEVAQDAGYFDQAHLTRSVRQLIGMTPGRLVRERPQLSFSYKTGDA